MTELIFVVLMMTFQRKTASMMKLVFIHFCMILKGWGRTLKKKKKYSHVQT